MIDSNCLKMTREELLEYLHRSNRVDPIYYPKLSFIRYNQIKSFQLDQQDIRYLINKYSKSNENNN